VEDFGRLLGGAGDAFADESEEAGDVLEADGGGGVGAEDVDVSECGFDELVVGSGAGDRRLVEEFVVDDVGVAAAFVALPADEAPALQVGDRLGDARRNDLGTPGGSGRGEAARVGGEQNRSASGPPSS
jgi:hypothetical protein